MHTGIDDLRRLIKLTARQRPALRVARQPVQVESRPARPEVWEVKNVQRSRHPRRMASAESKTSGVFYIEEGAAKMRLLSGKAETFDERPHLQPHPPRRNGLLTEPSWKGHDR